jgi:hypothetical protein
LGSESNRRRTLYAKISRHELNPLLRLFDFPDPNVTAATRTTTTVPLQQLFVLNSEFLVQQSKGLATRAAGALGLATGDLEWIDSAFRLALGRRPSLEERDLGQRFLASVRSEEGSRTSALTAREQFAQAILSSNEFMFVD